MGERKPCDPPRRQARCRSDSRIFFAGIAAGLCLLWLSFEASAQTAPTRPACSGELTAVGRLICDDFLLSWQDGKIAGGPEVDKARWQAIEERCTAVLAQPVSPRLARSRQAQPTPSLRDCVADQLLQEASRLPEQPAPAPIFAGKDAAVACLPGANRLEVRFPMSYGARAVTEERWLPPGAAAPDRFRPIAPSKRVACRFDDGRALRVGRGTQDDIRVWVDKRLVTVLKPGREWVSRLMLIDDVLWECSALAFDTAARCLAVRTVPGSGPVDQAEFPDPGDPQAGRFALLYAEDEILCRALIDPAGKARETVLIPSSFRLLEHRAFSPDEQSRADVTLRLAIADSIQRLPFHVAGYKEMYAEADTGRPERSVLILDDRDQHRQVSLLSFHAAQKTVRRVCWLEARDDQ